MDTLNNQWPLCLWQLGTGPVRRVKRMNYREMKKKVKIYMAMLIARQQFYHPEHRTHITPRGWLQDAIIGENYTEAEKNRFDRVIEDVQSENGWMGRTAQKEFWKRKDKFYESWKEDPIDVKEGSQVEPTAAQT